jgi:hypothetical protein
VFLPIIQQLYSGSILSSISSSLISAEQLNSQSFLRYGVLAKPLSSTPQELTDRLGESGLLAAPVLQALYSLHRRMAGRSCYRRARTSLSDPFLSGDIEYLGDKLLCLGLTRSDDVSSCHSLSEILRHRVHTRYLAQRRSSLLPERYVRLLDSGVVLPIECVKYLKHDTMVGMHCAIQSSKGPRLHRISLH